MAGEVNDTTIVGGASVNMVTEANAANQAGLAADGANKGVPGDDDIDFERVVHDGTYRRQVIDQLNGQAAPVTAPGRETD